MDRIVLKAARFFNTIKYLKAKQIAWQVFYRIRPRILQGWSVSTFIEKRGTEIALAPALKKPNSLSGKATFCFINISSEFRGKWDDKSNGKLWAYNLNYMDYLCQHDINYETGIYWIKRFIGDLKTNNIGNDPYPASLRNINWIKFISEHRSSISPEESSLIDSTLWASYIRLSRNPEYHLLGNHLLENGFSLLFGSFYFCDKRIYEQAEHILLTELKEQVLNDGAHFELSPMYHAIILERLFDCINLLTCNKNVFPVQNFLLEVLKSTASRMLGWLNSILLDGVIPLLNDSAYGISARGDELLEYSKRLSLTPVPVKLSESGYRKYKGKNYEIIADIGRIGPDYIPGHAHSDTFSFVLNAFAAPLIVDTGVSTYNNDSRRQVERGTLSHNTVAVNGKNSSDVWGSFRVGKRAHVISILDSNDELIAGHDGYKSIRCFHRRRFLFREEHILIEDQLSGDLPGISSLHFHPGINVEIKGRQIITDKCIIDLDGFSKTEILKFEYCPGFNTRIEALKFQGTFYKKSSIKFTLIEVIPVPGRINEGNEI